MTDLYEFKGDTKNGLGYIKGDRYYLKVIRRGYLARVIGVLIGREFRWKIIILEPQFCPYDSIDSFLDNWDFVL